MNLSKDLINNLKKLQFSELSLRKVEIFKNLLLQFNKSYNLISKSSEKIVDNRHILDSAQIVKYINFKFENSLSDFGTGGGFPGILLAIYNSNPKFHVKLHEKSKVKCDFLKKCIKNLRIKATVVHGNLQYQNISSYYITCRAFKKLPDLLRISREITKKPHRIIILKGKSSQADVDKALKGSIYRYRIEKSITNIESKILILDAKKK